ncbi:MFS transporter [Trabulsiella odontotermitis]|uniref:MFS transporter n=1 Tax=Trabulsiella odontotermitis TaxID=379893 RepID=UPI000A5487CE|nr:MFS transporter [Trabulsiella odontotermitis]
MRPALRQQPQQLLSIAAIFVYVGVEVAIATSLVKYLTLSAGWSPETAMSLVSLYWGGALVGRLLFGLFAHNAHNATVFRAAALLGVLLVALATGLNNAAGGWLLLLTGLGNSVMYPIIFGHTLSQFPQQANLLAAAMVMAGIGGAIIPWLQAVIIDNVSLHLSFLLPMALYALLAVWGKFAFAKEKKSVAPDRCPLP